MDIRNHIIDLQPSIGSDGHPTLRVITDIACNPSEPDFDRSAFDQLEAHVEIFLTGRPTATVTYSRVNRMEPSLGYRLLAMSFYRHIIPPRVTIEARRYSVIASWRLKGTRQSKLMLDHHSLYKAKTTFERPGAEVIVGHHTFVSGTLSVAQRVEFGDYVHVGWDTTILDHDSHSMEFEHRMSDLTNLLDGRKDWTHVPITPVKISSKSWVCFGATILRGVIVGEGAVVGAKSVVTRDVEPWTVVAGNPAKFIRNLKPS